MAIFRDDHHTICFAKYTVFITTKRIAEKNRPRQRGREMEEMRDSDHQRVREADDIFANSVCAMAAFCHNYDNK